MPLQKIDLLPINAYGSIKGCWTIDHSSGVGDNGFLDCARSLEPGAGTHASTASAVTNLVNCFSAGGVTRWANIVGHGNDGFIITGTGQNAPDTENYIAWYNQTTWGPELRRLKGFVQMVRLWSCHPGTGWEGAELLYNMMQETNAICMGPTGFLYCGSGGFSLEPNATWQVATPGQPKPDPINAPTSHFILEYQQLEIVTSGRQHVIPLQNVVSVEILSPKGQLSLDLAAKDAADVLRLVDFTSPMEIDGVPAALPTGTLALTFMDDKGGEQRRAFQIYNSRLLQDQKDKRVFYRCSESFGRVLTLPLQ